MPIKTLGSLGKIRVGRVTGNTHIFFFGLRVSKTNQRGMPTVLRIPTSDSSLFCCVTALQQYLCLRPLNAHYFLSHLNGKPMTRSQFSAVLAKAIRILRLPTGRYTSHSF